MPDKVWTVKGDFLEEETVRQALRMSRRLFGGGNKAFAKVSETQSFGMTARFSPNLESSSCPAQDLTWEVCRVELRDREKGRWRGKRKERGLGGTGRRGRRYPYHLWVPRHYPRLSTPLPQVKELGVVMYNCSCLARDLTKIFEAYWYLGQAGSSIPSTWPRPYDTRYNQETPMEICLNGTPALAYLAVSLKEEGPVAHWPHALMASICLARTSAYSAWAEAWAMSQSP